MDVRFPMTIRSRGNWSVLYVRIVCATTLPKCLVHMVRSLKNKKINAIQTYFAFHLIHLIIVIGTESIFLSQEFPKLQLEKAHEHMHKHTNTYSFRKYGQEWVNYIFSDAQTNTREIHKTHGIKDPFLLFLIPSE